MTIGQGILLGVVQGSTEFLPVSSSGHLTVIQHLLTYDDIPLLFDVCLHVATLAAVIVFFRKKLGALCATVFRLITRRTVPDEQALAERAHQQLIAAIITTTAITAIIGVGTSRLIPALPLKAVFIGFILTGGILCAASWQEKKRQPCSDADAPAPYVLTAKQALIIGCAQGIGTLPGISRSGATIAGALFAGVPRIDAGEFSFIVSIPAIFGAFILELKDVGTVSESIGMAPVIAGCIAAAVSGYGALAVLMQIVKRGKLVWFAAYLIPLGILGLVFAVK
ncbi:MAG: undecaprenyl-diphosphate phosphatase [Treponema sp.]|nr:undecaprenyl-diphosphate phosphatase [Treponema sp.]